MSSLRTIAAIHDDVIANPYASVLGQTLSARCDAIQAAYAGSHHCDLRHEMALVRSVAADVIQRYASAVELTKFDPTNQGYDLLLELGKQVQSALERVRDFAVSVAGIEKSFRDLHDPQITRLILSQVADVVDNALRLRAREGDISEELVNDIMGQLARDVETVRMPGAEYEFDGPSKLTPDALVMAMDETVVGKENIRSA